MRCAVKGCTRDVDELLDGSDGNVWMLCAPHAAGWFTSANWRRVKKYSDEFGSMLVGKTEWEKWLKSEERAMTGLTSLPQEP